MRATLLSCALICIASSIAGSLLAFEVEDRARFGPSEAEQTLRIVSTADISFFEPMIQSYLTDNPRVAVDYVVASSTELMQAIQRDEVAFDIAISSAMDLQTKLANDGFAMQHSSAAIKELPDWASWNDMLFAFTEEPATIVVSKAGFSGRAIPQTRHDLIEMIRSAPERFRGRVGTYDVRQSGLGYLFATQDTRASDTFWRLAEVFGALEVKLFCCSSDMIEAVKTGELLVAYNVLGSYVASREDRADFEIILPTDFTTVMLRTALIPANAPTPELSRAFIDHTLSRSFGAEATPLVDPNLGTVQSEASFNRIAIGPGLLVYLDQLKRIAFLNEWDNAILQKQ